MTGRDDYETRDEAGAASFEADNGPRYAEDDPPDPSEYLD